jgi:hypothetical protein
MAAIIEHAYRPEGVSTAFIAVRRRFSAPVVRRRLPVDTGPGAALMEPPQRGTPPRQ